MRTSLLSIYRLAWPTCRPLVAVTSLLLPLTSEGQSFPALPSSRVQRLSSVNAVLGPVVTRTTPPRNANAAPVGTNVTLTYDQAIRSNTAGAVRVFSQQAGGRKAATAMVTGTGTTLTVDPTTNFLPGEVVFVTAPITLQATDGTPATPYVFQFTTQAGVGPLAFAGPDFTVSRNPRGVAAADLNQDGRLDLLVVSESENRVNVLLGDGQGRFSSSATSYVPVSNSPGSLTVADINADGNLDFLTAHIGTNTVSVRLGDGRGDFAAASDVAVGTRPTAVVAADVNGDGNLDILTLNNTGSSSTVSVRLNTGQGRFLAASDVAVGTTPYSLTAADVNNDGKLDLLIGNDFDKVSVRLGDGQGGFRTGANVPAALSPNKILAVDVNGDGNLDLLTANITNTTVSVRLGDGQGNFTGTNNIYVGDRPVDIIAADMNGDGVLDLLAANSLDNTVSVLVGNGQGGFALAATVPVDNGITSVAAADVDGDGDLDLLATLAAGFSTGKVSVRLNQAAPTLTSFSPASGPAGTRVVVNGTGFSGVETVAFNGVLATSFVVNSPTQLTVTVPNGATTGRIAVTTLAGRATSGTDFTLSSGGAIVTSTTPARNANTAPLATNVSLNYNQAINPTSPNAVRVFSQQAGGRKMGTTTVSGNTLTFNPSQDFRPGEVVFVTSSAAVQPAGSQAKPYVYQFTTRAGVGPATFSGSEVRVDGQPNNVVVADVNNDGHLDFLTANRTITNTGNVSVRLGNGQGTFSGTTNIPIGNNPRDLVAADINGDGNLDFLALSLDNGTVNVRLGNGQAGFTAVPDVLVGSSPQRMAVADVNGDGNLDLLVTDFGSTNPSASGQVRVRLGNGQGGFSGTTNLAVSYGTRELAVADVNGDGSLDVLTGTNVGGMNSVVSIRLGDGQGNFAGTADIPMPMGSSLYSLVVADVNNDGNLDFLASNITNSSTTPSFITTYLGNGQASFSLAYSLPLITSGIPAGSPFEIKTADVNGDGNLDLVTANFSVDGTVSVRLGDGQGSFSGTLNLPAGFRPSELAIGDIDGDGDLDLLVANFGDNAVGVLRNQPLPSITSFSPTSGPVGTSVVLTGANFTGATAVTFNGTAATSFVVNSPTQLTVTVPVGATTGPIAVTTPAATAISSTSFQVAQAPVVMTTAGITTALEQVTAVVDAGLTITDADSPVLTSATVRITDGLVALEDVLDVRLINGFSYNYNNGVLTITGTSTVAQWQAILRTTTYTNRSANPTTTPRTISFEVSDGTLSSVPATKVVQVQAVNGAPAIPVDADPAPNTVAERAAPGTPVGITVSATDADGPTLTYSLPDDAGGRFTINPTTGVVTVANGALLDYVVATAHVITAQASDGTLTSSQRFSIQVTPVNNAPVIANQRFTAAENAPNGTVVGTIVASDPDAGQTLTYTLVSGNTGSAFTVVGNELRVANSAALLLATTPSFTLGVRVTDNGTPSLSATALLTVQLTRVSCTAPVLTPPADQRVAASSGQCSASIAFAATATGTPTPTLRYTIGTTPITSPYTFPVGTTSVTVTATNNCATTTDTFTVTVEDQQAPVIRAAGFITAIERNGLRTIEAADVDWGSFDNCSGIALMTISPRTFTCANIGPNQVTLTVTDNAGNSASETVTVILVDNSAPVIVAAGFETTLVNGTRTIEVADIDYGSYDQCGSIASMSISPRTFTCANVGPNPVTLTVTDNSGNVASQIVTVIVAADATCPAAIATQSKSAAPSSARSGAQNQLAVYPNPAQEQATLRFQAVRTGPAQVQVYNTTGRLVATLYAGVVEQGQVYERTLSGTSLPAGLYICRFTQLGQSISQRLVLSK